MKKKAKAEIPALGAGDGFIGFASKEKHLIVLLWSCAMHGTVEWTVCEDARPGDLVLFYAMKPWHAFFAHGRVLKRLERKWGRRRNPMAEVGVLRLLPEPVTLRRAKERLGMPWLRAAEGFGRQCQKDVHLILALGGA